MKKNAFTLIEVLVVATIISILATAGLVSYSSFIKKSRDERRKLDLEQIRSALEMYRSDNGYYPDNLIEDLITPGYLNALPEDPSTGQDYGYQNLPSGCDNTTTYCTDYIVGAIIEDTTQTTACSNIGAICKDEQGQSANCNYCLGPYGER